MRGRLVGSTLLTLIALVACGGPSPEASVSSAGSRSCPECAIISCEVDGLMVVAYLDEDLDDAEVHAGSGSGPCWASLGDLTYLPTEELWKGSVTLDGCSSPTNDVYAVRDDLPETKVFCATP